jgi:membrane protein DedA with SNARE-associated domain
MIERWFNKSRYLAVVAIPGPLTSLLAGVAAMPLALVFVLSAIGVAIRVALTLAVGEVFESPLQGVLGFLRDYQFPVLILTVGFLIFTLVREKVGSSGQESGGDDAEVPPKLGDP